MAKLQTKKQVNILTALMIIVYFSSYTTRINFAAVMVEFISAENVSKSATSIITTVAFITYGIGQLLSGYLGDKISPRILIFGGFSVTIIMNFLMPIVAPSIPFMTVLWGINGVSQAFMWPPLVKILVCSLSQQEYNRVVSKVGIGSGGGTIAVYLLAPVLIETFGWKSVFYAFGGLAVLVAAVWLISSAKLLKGVEYTAPQKQTELQKDDDTHISKKMKALSSASFVLLPVIILTIAIQGMLRDGISSWVPSFISETFGVKNSISILTSVAMPIFHLIFCLFSWRILSFFKNNVHLCIAIYFAIASVMLVLLYFFGFSNLWVAIILFSILSAFVHGINGYQTCYLVNYFASTQKVSFISGLLNFSTYIGSALSTYLFALISEKAGWGTNVLYWILFAAAGLLLTLISLFYTKHRLKKEGYKL